MTMLGILIASERPPRPEPGNRRRPPKPEEFMEPPIKVRPFRPLPIRSKKRAPIEATEVPRRGRGRNKVPSEYGRVLGDAEVGGFAIYRMTPEEDYRYVMKVLHKLANYRGFRISVRLNKQFRAIEVTYRTAD